MNKKFLYILLIFLIGCSALYLIADNSFTVGKASVNIDNQLFSIPIGYSLADNGNSSSYEMINDKTKMKIQINLISNYNNSFKEFNNLLLYLNNNTKYTVLDNNTNNINGINVYSIYYYDGSNNISSAFFYKNNNTFNIKSWDFNYNNDKEMVISNFDFIINSLRVNYKK